MRTHADIHADVNRTDLQHPVSELVIRLRQQKDAILWHGWSQRLRSNTLLRQTCVADAECQHTEEGGEPNCQAGHRSSTGR